jgi:HAMP domain-containing protein
MRFDNNGLYFVVDATNPGEPGASAYGERYIEPGPVLANNYKTIDRPLVETNFYTDEYGTFLSAYAPFYTSHAQLAGIIGADISAEKILYRERQVLLQFVIIFILFLPIVGYIGWLIGNRLAEPIRSLTAAAKRISEGDPSHRPNIRTGFSEVRSLRDAFFSMSDQLLSEPGETHHETSDRSSNCSRYIHRPQYGCNTQSRHTIDP